MTIQSFTSEHIQYEVTETSCSCPSFQFGKGRACKHLIAVQINKDATFAALRQRYDYRLNGTLETRRCYREMSLGF